MAIRLEALHQFILRNADLLPRSVIANYLGVTQEKVEAWMQALGIPDIVVLDAERAFPIVARRNHELLPEEEIARLVGMPVHAYRKMAMEMDGVETKLGKKPPSLPDIDPRASDFEAAASDFRAFSERYFRDYHEWERPFLFLEELCSEEDPAREMIEESNGGGLDIRMMNSYTGAYGDFLLTGEEFYSDGILSRLRNRGVNAGWIPVILRDLVPSRVFTEFGHDHGIRLENLRKQVEKAAKYGIRLFLYFNEPRCIPESFFEKYPNCKGMPAYHPGQHGMCTSDAMVRDWLRESTESLFRAVPDLSGLVLITASELRTNCWSHPPDMEPFGGSGMCPRCAERGPESVIVDTANLMCEGLKASGSRAEVIHWLWGWDYIMPMEGIKRAISNLAGDVTVMVDWARQTPFSVFGKNAKIIEYTMAYVKPSQFAQDVLETAREQGRRTMSKCALVSTIEMNALPYLPVMSNVEELLAELRRNRVDGMMGCWIFGGYPGRNMEMLAHYTEERPAELIARKYYGEGAGDALEAWKRFSEGMNYYPSSVTVLYTSAISSGPGLRFSLEPGPWRGGTVAVPTEDLEYMTEPFGPEAMIKGFRKVAEYFEVGLGFLKRAIGKSQAGQWHDENLKDYAICEACMRHFLSAANYAEFILVRNKWLEDKRDKGITESLIRILGDELRNSEAMFSLVRNDSRMGYEGSIGYFYTPTEIIEKMYDITSSVERLGSEAT